MRCGLCLHGGAVARTALTLHPTDRRAIHEAVAAGAEVIAVEAVGARGSSPIAANQALAAGAAQVIRLVDPALESSDPHATAYVLATAFDSLRVDAILFGDDADPEGIADVAARVAHNMSAIYLCGVTAVRTTADAGTGNRTLEVTITGGPGRHRLRLPLNVVLGIAPDEADAEPRTPSAHPATVFAKGPPASGAVAAAAAIEVRSLADLKVDATQVLRRHDGRGPIEVAARPLVTLQSAAAVAALLRR